MKLRDTVAQRLGFNATDVVFADGEVRSAGAIGVARRRRPAGDLVAEDSMEYGDLSKQFRAADLRRAFRRGRRGRYTGEVRVRRMLAVCAAGASSIPTPRAVRSSAA